MIANKVSASQGWDLIRRCNATIGLSDGRDARAAAAGYEVIDQTELSRLAPEFATWTSLPNYSQGKYGTYVVPTGQSLRFLPGDASKRDTTAKAFGVTGQIFAVSGGTRIGKPSPANRKMPGMRKISSRGSNATARRPNVSNSRRPPAAANPPC